MLLQLCFTLKDIAIFNAKKGIENVNNRISGLIREYLHVALFKREFIGIDRQIMRIIREMCEEYAKGEAEYEFLIVSELSAIANEIGRCCSAEKIFDFIEDVSMLGMIAIGGKIHFRFWLWPLTLTLKELGIESARRHLRLTFEIEKMERRLSEWSITTLKAIKYYIEKNEELCKRIGQDTEYSDLFSKIDKYIQEITEKQTEFKDLG